LAQYLYNIVYCQGNLYVAPDALSHAYCASNSENTLYTIHSNLCRPGIMKTYHFIRTKNLPYSWNEVKVVIEKNEAGQSESQLRCFFLFFLC